MTAIWVNMIIGGILLFYLSGILVVIGLLSSQRLQNDNENEKLKKKNSKIIRTIKRKLENLSSFYFGGKGDEFEIGITT